jgi:hypothetical protein
MTFTAPFAQIPRTLSAAVTAAIGGLGTDTITGSQLLITAGANGAVVTGISAMPRATVTASSLVLFLVKAATPNVYRPIDSVLMAAYTQAVTTALPVTTFPLISDAAPLRLEAGDKIYVGSEVALAAGIVFTGRWMDY